MVVFTRSNTAYSRFLDPDGAHSTTAAICCYGRQKLEECLLGQRGHAVMGGHDALTFEAELVCLGCTEYRRALPFFLALV